MTDFDLIAESCAADADARARLDRIERVLRGLLQDVGEVMEATDSDGSEGDWWDDRVTAGTLHVDAARRLLGESDE